MLEKLDEWRPARIGEEELQALRSTFAPISESWVRKVIRESGFPMTPVVEGVRQDSMEALDLSLLALLAEYERAGQTGDRDRARTIRRLVIQAKDHAKLAARRADGEKLLNKQEMILRMLTWLENPGIFRHWIGLRNARLSRHEEGG